MKKILKLIRITLIIYSLIFIIKQDKTAIFMCLVTLLLLYLSNILQKKLKYSDALSLLIYLFIISGIILGNIYSFFTKVWYFDIILHVLSSFIIGALSIYVLKYLTPKINKKLLIVFAFIFCMAIASLWEIGEFTIDRIFSQDMQKDTVITEITSTMFSNDNNTPSTRIITNVKVNNTDFMKKYGGYIDIGLYDTIEDMICALIGAILFIIAISINKKKYT